MNVNNLKRTRELNGINSLEFETDKKIEKGNRLVFKDYQGIWNEYIVQEVEILHEGLKIEYSVFCEQSINELFGHFILDLKPRQTKATAIVDKVLQDTRFSVGHIDDLGLRSFNLYHIDAKSALWKIIDMYDCDIDVSIDVKDSKVVGRYINLYKHKGSFEGKRYTYKKDIKSIKKTIDYTNIATKLYGYGKGEEIVDEDGKATGGYGRKINFSEINDGKPYVTNEEARLKYGVGKEKRHIEGIFEDGDCEDKKELLELTKKELEKRSKPQISYELKVEDLSKYPGFEFEGVGLGDDVIVKDKELDFTVYTRIIKIIDSPFDNSDTKITLGNYIKDISNKFLEYENLKKSIESRNISIGEEIDKLAKSTEQGFLKSLVDRLNTELNATGGYVYFEQGKGIIILNAPKEGNPTQAITLKGGTIAIANKKKANGDWDWTTFGTGNGFTASVLTAGILKGGKVRWNLEDGTLLIGNNPDDYNLYWDGETLNLRNTKIDYRYDKTINDLKDNLDKKISKEDILEDKEIQEALRGKDGEPGKQGVPGIPGKNGKTGKIGQNLLRNSNVMVENKDYNTKEWTLCEIPEVGEIMTYTAKVKLEKDDKLMLFNSGGMISLNWWDEITKSQDYVIYSSTFNWKDKFEYNGKTYEQTNPPILKLYTQSNGNGDNKNNNTVSIEWATLTRGDIPAIEWYPCYVDVDDAIKAGKEETEEVSKKLIKVESDFKIDSNKIKASVSSLSETTERSFVNLKKDIADADVKVETGIKNYLINNYSTKTQTDQKISQEVGSVKASISNINQEISRTKTSIEQTNKKIETKVSKDGFSSLVKQEFDNYTVQARNINFDGSYVNVKGSFQTLGGDNDVGIKIDYNDIVFRDYRGNGTNYGSITVVEDKDSNNDMSFNIGHFKTGHAAIRYWVPEEKVWRPYVSFDKWYYTNRTSGYPITFYEGVDMKGNLHLPQQVNFDCVRMRTYSDALAIETFDGKAGLVIKSDGSVYIKDAKGSRRLYVRE